MTHIPHPDPLPLREILRGLRHGMRRSRRVLRETLPPESLPGPAGLLARRVLEGLDALAQGVDATGTSLAKRLLGGEAHRAAPFEILAGTPDRDEEFAEAVYVALRGALCRIGDGEALVSEAAARRAHAAASRAPTVGGRGAVAADLVLALLDAGAVRDVAPVPGLRVPTEGVAAVAATAAMLWLLADHQGSDADAALDAATDIAVALAGEVASAVAARDRPRLARLLDEFASHV